MRVRAKNISGFVGYLLISLSISFIPTKLWARLEKKSISTPIGDLQYFIYIPKSLKNTKDAPVIMALHGCTQDVETFRAITRYDDLAESEGFLVVYPVQPKFRNCKYCWNWFLGMNQSRFLLGESSALAQTILSVVYQYGLNEKGVFLSGFSAGAGMGANLQNNYPEIFKAVFHHSGPGYLAATINLLIPSELARVAKILVKGSPSSPEFAANWAYLHYLRRGGISPTMILFGSKDPRVSPVHSDYIFKQTAKLNELLSGGNDNNSLSQISTLISKKNANAYPYTTKEIKYCEKSLIKLVTVEGLEHSWSGGPSNFANSDPRGPDATRLSWEFFSSHLKK